MIELRWIITNSDFNYRKLQYRQQVDTTVRAGMWPAPDMARTANMQWSDWRDVPEVHEPPVYSAPSNKCPRCTVELTGSMSYVCPVPDCPSGLGSSMS